MSRITRNDPMPEIVHLEKWLPSTANGSPRAQFVAALDGKTYRAQVTLWPNSFAWGLASLCKTSAGNDSWRRVLSDKTRDRVAGAVIRSRAWGEFVAPKLAERNAA